MRKRTKYTKQGVRDLDAMFPHENKSQTRMVTCAACKGTGLRVCRRGVRGQRVAMEPCPRCGGDGCIVQYADNS